jgi:hypothetical protein
LHGGGGGIVDLVLERVALVVVELLLGLEGGDGGLELVLQLGELGLLLLERRNGALVGELGGLLRFETLFALFQLHQHGVETLLRRRNRRGVVALRQHGDFVDALFVLPREVFEQRHFATGIDVNGLDERDK